MPQRVTHVAVVETGFGWVLPLQCVLSQGSRTSSLMSDFLQKERNPEISLKAELELKADFMELPRPPSIASRGTHLTT